MTKCSVLVGRCSERVLKVKSKGSTPYLEYSKVARMRESLSHRIYLGVCLFSWFFMQYNIKEGIVDLNNDIWQTYKIE
ncbi:unnamed protein product [Lactuca virosa]|uniref:Uncharacterized protein n=1 Tax=Lactuca virosa TaxID=75947 RepID=A0AAU9MNL0_9ASTR|nr:unnamed protein product [Lactuca virosa]